MSATTSTLAATRERRATAGSQRRDDDFAYSEDDSGESDVVEQYANTDLSLMGPTPEWQDKDDVDASISLDGEEPEYDESETSEYERQVNTMRRTPKSARSRARPQRRRRASPSRTNARHWAAQLRESFSRITKIA